MTINSDPTDVSSEFDATAVENDAFDKHELIVWASKLELESIDYRSTSMDLIEQLSKISKQLTDSLDTVKVHVFNLKINAAEKDRKYKNFIELTVNEELDDVYEKISLLAGKIKTLQKSVALLKNQNTDRDDTESVFNQFMALQREHNKRYEQRIKSLELSIEKIKHTQRESNNVSEQRESNVLSNIKKIAIAKEPSQKAPVRTQAKAKRPPTKIKETSKLSRITKPQTLTRRSTFTRKLIFE